MVTKSLTKIQNFTQKLLAGIRRLFLYLFLVLIYLFSKHGKSMLDITKRIVVQILSYINSF